MTRRVILTGSGGFVGSSLIRQVMLAGTTWEIHALTRSALEGPGGESMVLHVLDVLDDARLSDAISEIKPGIIIHAAAIADIDYCEKNRDEARRVNIELTQRLADLARPVGAKFVYLSTDTVFDGERGNYAEEDAPRAVNYYAETKIAAEEIVKQYAGDWVIARLALVMGLPQMGTGNSFVARLIAAFREGRTVSVPEAEIRTPVDVVTLARAIIELAGGQHTGIFHLAGNEKLNRLVMTRRIARRLGYDENLVQPQPASAMIGRAPRPRDVSLNNAKSRAVLKTPMLDLYPAMELSCR
ncbi:SDR family oxidoreductase [Candidatus Sumerlaeota bacterium]|nr:SDR family oxidoreductase [Candidatus Sumerlaeota bacterium]MBI3736351.1 SDR family oxidoreductase [Candidatus Sumerlaeota bacterium]